MTSRLRFARNVPSNRMLWLAQVALRAKKKVDRKDGNKAKPACKWGGPVTPI